MFSCLHPSVSMEKVKKKVGIANIGAFVMAFLSVTKAC